MNILLITDPIPSLKAYKDSSVAMMRALQARGHTLTVCQVDDLFAGTDNGKTVVAATVSGIQVNDDDHDWYRLQPPVTTALTRDNCDVILMRKDPPFDMEYIYATYLLELAESVGVKVVNPPSTLRNFNEKLAILRYPEFTPPTLVSRQPAKIQAFIDANQDVILKPLDGMGGTGIFRVTASDPNRNVIVETLNRFGKNSVMAQKYLPAIADGDKRVLLINGTVVPFALARIPQGGETRGNLAAGGKGVAMELTSREKAVATEMAARLKTAGLFLVGLDLIGGHVTEINVTSPTCFVEIGAQSGYNAANLFAEQLEVVAYPHE